MSLLCDTITYFRAWPPPTLVSNLVKVADKGEIRWVIKFVKTGLRLLLDNGLEVLSPNMAHFNIKVIKNHPKKLPVFSIFF